MLRDQTPLGIARCLAVLILAASASHGGLDSSAYAAEERITIEVGTTSVPKQAESWFRDQIRTFEIAHPNIRVETTALTVPIRPVDTSLRKLPRLADNVIGIQGTFDDEAKYLASRELIVPIDRFLPDPEFSFDDFHANAWPSVAYREKIWGVPWFMDSMWLFCDWELFEEAGIIEPPATWDAFWECLEKLTKDRDGDGVTDQWGIRITPNMGLEPMLWMTLDLQDGVKYFQNGKLTFEQPVIEENLAFVQKLVNSPYHYRGSTYSFALGKSASAKTAMFLITNFSQHIAEVTRAVTSYSKNKRLRAIPLPTDGRPALAPGLRLYLAVRKSTPEEEAASWEFIKWINRADAPLPDFWYGYPCRKDFWDRPDVENWEARLCQDHRAIFESSSRTQMLDFAFEGRHLYTFMSTLSPLYDGTATPAETIQALQKKRRIIQAEPVEEVRLDALFQ